MLFKNLLDNVIMKPVALQNLLIKAANEDFWKDHKPVTELLDTGFELGYLKIHLNIFIEGLPTKKNL